MNVKKWRNRGWMVLWTGTINLGIMGPAGGAPPEPPFQPDNPELGRLIRELRDVDAGVAREARKQLQAMGESVVPRVFQELVKADWIVKARLLDTLEAHGRDFARQKLSSGSELERIYAAIVYELVEGGGERIPSAHKAMVAHLLKALDSDDKNLRAVAALALLHDKPESVFFEHFHKLVPAMISSCGNRSRPGGQ